MKVYISQLKPYLGNIEKNLLKHEEEIRKALSEKADLIIFPELSLTGYYLRDLAPDMALRLNSPMIKIFENYSEDINIIIGFVYEDEEHNFYNAAAYFENGSLKHIHKKVFLPNYTMFEEARYFGAGDDFLAFDMMGEKTGLLICEDALHLSSLYIYSLQKVKNIIIISNSPARGIKPDQFYSQQLWYDTIRFISRNMTVYTIFVNRVGVEDGITFWGGSMVVDPFGDVKYQAELLKEMGDVVNIDDSSVRRSRITSPFYRDEDVTVVKRYISNMGSL